MRRMRIKVKKEWAIIYNAKSGMKALVALKVGQRWRVLAKPEEHRPWYTIRRGSTVVDISTEDVEQYFVEVTNG